jgi:hypothetical protein
VNLPRIFIEVNDDPGGGWAVQARAAEDGHVFGAYHMESTKVGPEDNRLRVPVVPPSRRPDGADEHSVLCSGDATAIGQLLDRLASESTENSDVRVYGRWLFECLLAPVWQDIREYPPVKEARGLELALQWPVSEADLHRLIWEAMHDSMAPLAGLPDTLVVVTRVIQTDYPAPTTITRAPKVLFATGSSLTDEVIRPGAMFMGLLRKLDAEGICLTHAVQDVSITDLQVACQAFEPDVVHLVAHGETLPGGRSVLLLGSRDTGSPVGAAQLRQALTAGSVPLAVVLSACHSGGGIGALEPGDGSGAGEAGEPVAWRAAPLAAELVAGGIPIVTAMAGAVSEPACRMYTTRLIDAIHRGAPLSRAAAEGRAAALTAAPEPARQLDWAMPTIFLSSSVQPDFCPLDPTSGRRLVGIADSLKLRKKPVFIGRQPILRTVDDLFSEDPDRRTGFLAIGREGTLEKLGSTRLLEEIGFRLLRTGHVPLLLANYSEVGFGEVKAGPPRTLRGVLAEVLQQAVRVTRTFNLPPPRLRTLGVDPSFDADDAVAGSNMAGLAPAEASQRALKSIRNFAMGTGELDDVSLVEYPLGADLAELADIMAGAGEPFGKGTRAVLLADRVHEWTGAVGPLLQLIGHDGLGRPGKPAPVIVTCSLTGGEGQKLKSYRDDNIGSPGVRFLELAALTGDEAALGFQWVLLNPWHPQERYRRVYVAARTTRQSDVQQILSVFDGEPASVRLPLYQVVQSQTVSGKFVDHDDTAAFDKYEKLHP